VLQFLVKLGNKLDIALKKPQHQALAYFENHRRRSDLYSGARS
jgi:hypothetical protein